MVETFVLVMIAFLVWRFENSAPLFDVVGEVLLRDGISRPRRLLICIKGKGEQKVVQAVEVDEKLFKLVKKGSGVIVTYRYGRLTGRIKILGVV